MDDYCPIDASRRLQLGEMLIHNERLSQEQLDEALEQQRSSSQGKLLGELLIEMGFVTQLDVMECLAKSYGVPFARVTPRIADPRMIDLLPRDFIDTQCVLPLFCVHDTLTVAISEPANLFLLDEIERLSGRKIQVVASTSQDIRSTLQAYLPSANVFVIDEIYADVDVQEFSVVESEIVDIGEIEEASGQSPVIKLVNYVLYQATQERASDIHIEPDDHGSRIRYRIDGRLVTKLNPPYQMHPAVVSRIKIMAKMDISERRVPQDGDIHIVIDGRPIDLRISTMPGKFGEKVVIRIIDSRNTVIPLEKMGMSKGMLDQWREVIAHPNGMVLVTGPTGSGKSTTLYSVLSEIASDELNISTVENPVEAQLPAVNQFQINERAGFTFPMALRALLRQDPDVLMVGEIRDLETATIAAQAALTGHLIFSTLHTNDALSAVTRLANMGIESFLIAAMLKGVLAQRLVRRICPHCKISFMPDAGLVRRIPQIEEGVELHRGEGCSRCRGTGYAGRLGIHELFIPEDVTLDAISSGQALQEFKQIALAAGHQPLSADGFAKARLGLTTVEEVLRVCAT